MKSQYKTFAETEALLHTAIELPGNTIKHISAATSIKANTLYKWKTAGVHLSPQKADRLLLYFIHNEPDRLAAAELLMGASKNNIDTVPVFSSGDRCSDME